MATGNLQRVSDPHQVPSRLNETERVDLSVVTLMDGGVEDLKRLHESLVGSLGSMSWEHVIVSNASDEIDTYLEEEEADVVGVSFSQHVGFAAGINAGLVQAAGHLVAVVDPSVEATGDPWEPMRITLEDETVGIVGPWGLVTSDLREFEEATEGDVDAMQAYFMGFRRDDLNRVGLFDPKFKFYRHADIDFSLSWKDAGYRIVVLSLPLRRHEHRAWEALPPDQREKKSRENHARLMRRWRDRTDLLVGARGRPAS